VTNEPEQPGRNTSLYCPVDSEAESGKLKMVCFNCVIVEQYLGKASLNVSPFCKDSFKI